MHVFCVEEDLRQVYGAIAAAIVSNAIILAYAFTAYNTDEQSALQKQFLKKIEGENDGKECSMLHRDVNEGSPNSSSASSRHFGVRIRSRGKDVPPARPILDRDQELAGEANKID